MALKQITAHKPARSPRLPGETAVQWTVRTAYLAQKPSGRWIIFYTDVLATGAYRTSQQACFTLDANEAAIRLAEWRQARLTPAVATSRKLSFCDLVDRYLADTSRDRLTRAQQHVLNPARGFFANDMASMITRERMREFRDHMETQGAKPGTTRVRLAAVLTALRFGVKHDHIPAGSVPDCTLPPPSPPRQYVLTSEQIAAVFNAAAERFRQGGSNPTDQLDTRTALFVCVAAETAQRIDAIKNLTWDRIDLTPGHETLDFRRPGRAPKNKKAAVVPVSARLLPVLQHAAATHETGTGGLLFNTTHTRTGFDRFKAKHGLPKLTPHVFRHSWATRAIRSGMPVGLVAKILGDDVATVLKTYTHLVTEDTREAMNKYMAA